MVGSREIDGSVLMEREVGKFGRVVVAWPHLAQLVSPFGHAIPLSTNVKHISNLINNLS